MNWLIYIGGWVISSEIITQTMLVRYENLKNYNEYKNIADIFWTMCWIWICWRFIR